MGSVAWVAQSLIEWRCLENGRWRLLEGEQLISLSEAAALSGLSAAHLRRLAERGDLEAQKVGRNWITTQRAVERYLGDEAKRRIDPYKRRR